MMECAHCHTPAKVRSSKTVTSTYRELYYQCLNIDCGHTWKASLAFIHTISPSARPLPGLDLAMMPVPAPANDRNPATLPVTPRDNANDDLSQGAPAMMSPRRSPG